MILCDESVRFIERLEPGTVNNLSLVPSTTQECAEYETTTKSMAKSSACSIVQADCDVIK